MEKEADDSANEDEDKGNKKRNASCNDPTKTAMAEKIYKEALRTLKLKLYFENFFPADTDKDNLPYNCWTSAVASMSDIDGGDSTARKMFYEFGYDNVVRNTIEDPTPHAKISLHLLDSSSINGSALSGVHL